jgi:hypothetical protein
MFILFEFKKINRPASAKAASASKKSAVASTEEKPLLTPCIYKKR